MSNLQIENFDDFIDWLKKDGLKPVTSERLWRKKIFSNLLNKHQKTVENYEDYLENRIALNLLNKHIVYRNIRAVILEINNRYSFYEFVLSNNVILKVKKEDLEELQACVRKGN